jgi:hypothetical protein
MMQRLVICLVPLVLLVGCNSKPATTEITGTVTFKGAPIPAGDVTFMPDVTISGGQMKMYMVKEGKYDSKADTGNGVVPGGLLPGKYKVRINGYDGKQIPMYYSGKQIFNAIELEIEIAGSGGVITQDFTVPDSAGENVKYIETADF